MPNLFKTVLVRRFLAHSLEILTIFVISILSLSLINYIFSITNYKVGFFETGLTSQLTEKKVVNSDFNSPDSDRSSNALSAMYTLVVLFTLYYFVFTAFNFFFSFSLLYPNNDYKVGIAYKLFGFSHFDFGKKKLTHFKKSMKIVYRELVFALTIYGIFFVLTFLNVKVIVKFLSNFMGYGNSFLDLFLTVFYLFCIFVLPSLILSLITLKKSKGKQLFWDYISGVTMK
jgi:hypothetical protein